MSTVEQRGSELGCFVRKLFLLGAMFSVFAVAIAQSQTNISTGAYSLLNTRTAANQQIMYVYLDQDSGFNHGFPSGFFASNPANLGTIHIDTGCIEDPNASNGCSTDPNVLDRSHVTVMRFSFDAQTSGNFAGVNIEEPENWGVLQTGTGYDLRGANSVTLDIRSPNGAMVQFGVGGCTAPYTAPIATTWTTITLPLDSLSCTPDLSDVHLLIGVATNDQHAPNGATVLVDNIVFSPVPNVRTSALGFPLGNQTFGVLPQESAPIPLDQVLRNLTTEYESALTVLGLLARGTAQDLTNAHMIADTFDYALHHESHGDPLPVAPDGSVGLHNGNENGDISLFNNQQPPKQGQADDIRLAGFTATTLCAPSDYCLVLDGATGGNNSFAILALVAAYEQFGDTRYMNDALMIGGWIVGNLTDTTGTGYGGYYLGYPDLGVPPPKPLQTGKSIENNADIFAAFTALATVESHLGNSNSAASWTNAANVAGDFVIQMFDSTNGRFNVGTVPVGTPPAPGICPTGPQKGNDVTNVCDFLDSNTFTTLAMAGSPRYQGQIDWREPIQYVLNNFAQTITVARTTFQGFDIVPAPVSGPNGIAWEFTGQTVEAMHFVDQLYNDTRFESAASSYLGQIALAQTSGPFGDGLGLVAATLQDGDVLPPTQQCLQTPFQCIGERIGLAATGWAILAEQKLNVFSPFSVRTLSPTNLSFSGQPITTTSASQPVTVTNAGNVALPISNIAASGDFAVSASGTTCALPSDLPAGASCIIGMTFKPTVSGPRAGTLTITTSPQVGPVSAALSGTGTDFSISSDPTSATVTAGNKATYTLSITPISGFNQTVALSCTGAPAPSTCTVSPPSLVLNGSAVANATVSVTTAGGSAMMSGSLSPIADGPYPTAPISAIYSVPLLGLAWIVRRRVSAIRAFSLGVVLCLASGLLGCGGGSSGGRKTPPGTYTLSVTGTFTGGQGTLNHAVSLKLTVN
jgi:hypothetical protein